jgi:hypothetical protein
MKNKISTSDGKFVIFDDSDYTTPYYVHTSCPWILHVPSVPKDFLIFCGGSWKELSESEYDSYIEKGHREVDLEYTAVVKSSNESSTCKINIVDSKTGKSLL